MPNDYDGDSFDADVQLLYKAGFKDAHSWSTERVRFKADEERAKGSGPNGAAPPRPTKAHLKLASSNNGIGAKRPDHKAKPKKPEDPVWYDVFVKTGLPKETCANARQAITALGIKCSYDIFHDKFLARGGRLEEEAGPTAFDRDELTNYTPERLRPILKESFGIDPGKANTRDAVVQLCLQDTFDPVLDYLGALQWDGESRIDSWLTYYFGAPDTDLNRAIGRIVLVAAVRRARSPGCKFDEILVLESEKQGLGRSSAIEILAGKQNFSDQRILDRKDKEQQELMAGIWIYEIAELSGMRKAEVEHVKAFASRKDDRARPAYGFKREDRPRRCIFIATSNSSDYLRDETGNRRFWPVTCAGKVKLAELASDRDQLWAEAAEAEAAGESIRLPEGLWGAAEIEQGKRVEHDPWDDLLASLKGVVCDCVDADGQTYQEERIPMRELWGVVGVATDKQSNMLASRLTWSMKRNGWDKPKNPIRLGNARTAPKVRGFIRAFPHTQPDETDDE